MADDPNVMVPPSISSAGEVLTWQVADAGERQRVKLRGEINENADFSDLTTHLSGDVDLDLEGISRINSCGVREWVNFVRDLRNVRTLRFERCSPVVVLQLNTIFNFRGRAKVSSFLAPYVCESCHADEYRLLVVDEHFPERGARQHPSVPSFRCQRCNGVMMFDELPERYLSFLAEEGT
jgi:anti-anti-sigma regulatory factor